MIDGFDELYQRCISQDILVYVTVTNIPQISMTSKTKVYMSFILHVYTGQQGQKRTLLIVITQKLRLTEEAPTRSNTTVSGNASLCSTASPRAALQK